jgi:hypothetical protein
MSSMMVAPCLHLSNLAVDSAFAEVFTAKSLIEQSRPFFYRIPATEAGHSRSWCTITLFRVVVKHVAFFAHPYTAAYTDLV